MSSEARSFIESERERERQTERERDRESERRFVDLKI